MLHCVLQLVVGAFNAVANHCAAYQTNQGGSRPATAVAHRIAGSASGQRAHQRARTGLGACVITVLVSQTPDATATCCTTGVLEITRARMSMADAGTHAMGGGNGSTDDCF